jgi:chaperone modulatory protein CbpM
MMRIDAVIARFPDLDAADITDWVARDWVRVEGDAPAEWVFSERAIARLHLVRELHVDLGVDTQTLPMVLGLVDQVYGLRGALARVLAALEDAPEDVRRRVSVAFTQER